MSHGPEGAQCEYNINNEMMKQIKLIMRYARMMKGNIKPGIGQCMKITRG